MVHQGVAESVRPSRSSVFRGKKRVTRDALGTRLLASVAFVRRRVEEHDGEDVQVPHAVDAGEEGAVHLHRVVAPVPEALVHLQRDKETAPRERRRAAGRRAELPRLSPG